MSVSVPGILFHLELLIDSVWQSDWVCRSCHILFHRRGMILDRFCGGMFLHSYDSGPLSVAVFSSGRYDVDVTLGSVG